MFRTKKRKQKIDEQFFSVVVIFFLQLNQIFFIEKIFTTGRWTFDRSTCFLLLVDVLENDVFLVFVLTFFVLNWFNELFLGQWTNIRNEFIDDIGLVVVVAVVPLINDERETIRFLTRIERECYFAFLKYIQQIRCNDYQHQCQKHLDPMV